MLDSRTFVYYYHNTSDGRIMLGKGGNTFAYDARMLPVFDQPSPSGLIGDDARRDETPLAFFQMIEFNLSIGSQPDVRSRG